MDDFANLISNLGFPIAMVVSLLFILEKRIAKIIDLIIGNNGLMQKVMEVHRRIDALKEKIDDLNKRSV